MTTAKKRGRPATGTIEPHGDHWDVRARLPRGGGLSPRRCLPAGTSEARAREVAAAMTELAATATPGAVVAPPPVGELFADWAERWCVAREAAGLTSVDDDRGRLRKWISPTLGKLVMVAITRADVEKFVEELDDKVRADELHWKTATNVWGLLTKAFDDACRSKTLALRVLTGNPIQDALRGDVRGPDRGEKKSKTHLYPADVLALLSCEAIPIQWRRMYAVVAYLYLRAAEARALEWPDLDLDHGVALIHQTEDKDGKMDSTKSAVPHRTPIEPAIVPLLRWMRDRAGAELRVFPRLPVEKHLAPMLRRHMLLAGLTRAELFANDSARKQMGFHDLRATGLTWRAVRGDDPMKIMRAAGHLDFKTTLGYVRDAQDFGSGYGDVFSPIPAALFAPGISPEWFGANGHAYKNRQKGVGEAGFEPAWKCSVGADYGYSAQESRAVQGRGELVGCSNEVAKCSNPGRWEELPGGNSELVELVSGVVALVLDGWFLAANDVRRAAASGSSK
jgi:integrase